MPIRANIIIDVNYWTLHSDTFDVTCHRNGRYNKTTICRLKSNFHHFQWQMHTHTLWLVTQFLKLTGIGREKSSGTFHFHQCIKIIIVPRQSYAKIWITFETTNHSVGFANCIPFAMHTDRRLCTSIKHIDTGWYTFFTPRYFIRNQEKFMLSMKEIKKKERKKDMNTFHQRERCCCCCCSFSVFYNRKRM